MVSRRIVYSFLTKCNVLMQKNNLNVLSVPGGFKYLEIHCKRMAGDTYYKGLNLSDVLKKLNTLASLGLAESWDNVGLLVEPITTQMISTVLLTNDLTEEVMFEALAQKVNLIISYHPPIFSPLKRITNSTWKERIVATCLENKIAVYSPHTAWDAAIGGVTDWLIQAFKGHFDDTKRKSLAPGRNVLDKDIFCVEAIGHPNNLHAKLKELSSGIILESLACSDGRMKYKIICSKRELNSILHLEDTDIFIVKKEPEVDPALGMGRLISVNNITIADCIKKIKDHTGLKYVRLALARNVCRESPVKTIALVPGSGGSLLKGVKADLYITGEMFHHDILEANHNGASVILTNHSDSERGYLKQVKEKLNHLFCNEVNIIISVSDKDPVETV